MRRAASRTHRTIRCGCARRRFLPNRLVKTPAPPRSLRDLRHLTPARVGLGRAGASLPTQALLEFTLDHARARDAVHAGLDISAIAAGLDALGLQTLRVSSCVQSRKDYLRRPDLGRKLDAASQDLLASGRRGRCDLAVVIGDGLSPSAGEAPSGELVFRLVFLRGPRGGAHWPPRVATGAR